MTSTSFIESTMFLKNATVPTVETWFIPLDIFMIACTTLVIILATLFLFIIVVDKTCHTISMILTANSCIGALLFGCSLLGYSLFTLQNDLKQIPYQDSLCIFRGYIGNVSGVLFNCSFLLQSLYRYIIVVYPNRLFCQSAKFQFLSICLTWIYAFVYSIPFTVTGEIIYNVDNQICQLPIRISFFLIYAALCIYIIPVSMIMFIYFKLVQYVHQMSKRVTPANILSRAQRELKMVKRIVIVVTILITLGFPYALFVFMSFFTIPPKYHFRIAYIFVDISLTFVMIALFQFTDPLKASIMKKVKRQPNRIVVTVT